MNRLIELYSELARLTHEACANCSPPFHCYVPLGCNHTRWWAKIAWDVELKEQQDGQLPFLGASG